MKRIEGDKSSNVLGILSTGHLTLDFYAAILIPLYPYIAQKLGITLALISSVIAIGHGASSVLQPVFGYISDKIEKRFFMFWGLIFASVFMPLGLIAPDAALLTLCLILGMIGNAFYHPQVTLIIKNFYKNGNLAYAMGIFLGLGTIGYALSPYISACIFQTLGVNYYVLIGLPGIICAICLLLLVPKIKLERNTSKINFKNTIKGILKNETCRFLILITVIKASLVMSYGTYIPFLLKKFDFQPSSIGFVITLFYIAGAGAMIIASKIENKLKLRGMIVLSYLPLLPLTLLALMFLKINAIVACVLFVAIGFFTLLAAGVVLACAQKTIPEGTGTISGIIQGFTLALGSLLLIPFGILGQTFGVETILITISLIAFCLAVLSFKVKCLD